MSTSARGFEIGTQISQIFSCGKGHFAVSRPSQGYEDLQAHMDNPHVQAHITWLNDGVLNKPVQIAIYCD